MDKVIRFRVSEGDRLLLQRAADKDSRNLSDWCRLRLVDAALRSASMSDVPVEAERLRGLSDPSVSEGAVAASEVLAEGKAAAKAARKASARKGRAEGEALLQVAQEVGEVRGVKFVETEKLAPVRRALGRPDPDKIAAAQDWLRKKK